MSACRVYVIAMRLEDRWGPVKVGIAESPRKRVSGLQVGNPYELMVWGSFDFNSRDSAAAAEAKFHEIFCAKRIKGEWFDIDPGRAAVEVERIHRGHWGRA